MNAVAFTLHAIIATIWVGGMFFAYVVLRPSAGVLEPPERLTLWAGVFKRFFPWVWVAVLVLPSTGYWLVFNVFAGFASSPAYVHAMHLLGLVMIIVFLALYYLPYRRFKHELNDENWPAAGVAMNRIRLYVLINLLIGAVLLVIVFAGRYG